MSCFNRLESGKLYKTVANDNRNLINKLKSMSISYDSSCVTRSKDYEYYTHNVAFYLKHTIDWCKQLDYIILFMSSFYPKKGGTLKGRFQLYNVENYYIRLNGVYDRVLQLINAIFNLGLHKEDVRNNKVLNNEMIKQNIDVYLSLKRLKKNIEKHTQKRHLILHKHSMLDKEMLFIELLYLEEMRNYFNCPHKKTIRANHLKSFTKNKKIEFNNTNKQLSKEMDGLFNCLFKEYEIQKAVK